MSKSGNHYASATVTLKIRVTGKGHWGSTATVGEVMEIGQREISNAVGVALLNSGLRYELIGMPEVGLITWTPEKPS